MVGSQTFQRRDKSLLSVTIEIGRRLVQQEHWGIMQQGLRDRDALALPAREPKTRFAHFIGDTLNERNAAGTFEELILVAPAQILAEIRDKLDTVTEAKVTGTLAKDLTKVPDHELYPHLKQWARPTQRP